MNTQNENLSSTDLKARCAQLGLHIHTSEPTKAEVIPLLERRIAEWQNHASANADQNTVEYIDWKLTLNSLNRFLLELRPFDGSQNQIPVSLQSHQGGTRCENLSKNRQATNGAPLTKNEPSGRTANTPDLTPAQKQISTALKAPGNPLDNLSDAQQRKLYELLCDHPFVDVLKIIGLPEPDGWAIETNEAALRRFFSRIQKRFLLEASRASLAANKESDELEDDPTLTDDQLTASSDRFFKLRLRNQNKCKSANIRDLWQLYQIHLRQKQLEIADRRLTYLERKQSNAQPTATATTTHPVA